MTVRFSIAVVFSGVALAATAPTFTKDVAPILYNRCLECHRPGEAGPMAFRTYQETRPWAKAIRQAVMTHNMPPWYADTTIPILYLGAPGNFSSALPERLLFFDDMLNF